MSCCRAATSGADSAVTTPVRSAMNCAGTGAKRAVTCATWACVVLTVEFVSPDSWLEMLAVLEMMGAASLASFERAVCGVMDWRLTMPAAAGALVAVFAG